MKAEVPYNASELGSADKLILEWPQLSPALGRAVSAAELGWVLTIGGSALLSSNGRRPIQPPFLLLSPPIARPGAAALEDRGFVHRSVTTTQLNASAFCPCT